MTSPNSSSALYSNWLNVSKTIGSSGFYSTSLSVLLFLTLSFFYVRTNYGNYKRYMVVFSLLGFALAALEFTVNPVFHSYNCGFVMFSLAHPLGTSTDVAFALLLSYCGLYAATISFLSVQFFYRYTAILYPKHVPTFFGGWKIVLWTGYALLFGVQWTFGVIYFAALDDMSTEYMRDEVLIYYGRPIEDIAMCALVAYEDDKKLRWRNLMCILNMTVIMGVQYTIIIFCGWRMSVEMREAVSKLSPVLWRLHTQFFRVLVLQIVVPTVTLFMPVFILMYTPLFDIPMRFPSGVMLSAFSFFPAMDAVIVMYILSDYKNTIKRIIGRVAASVQGAMRVSEAPESSTRTSRVTGNN